MANKVELLSSWESDFGDIRFNANLYNNNKLVANVIGSYDLPDYDDKRDKEKLIKEIYTDFDNNLITITIYANYIFKIIS